MVDAGFVDLVRPAMYGSYHGIEVIPHDGGARESQPIVVAGPLCESGDVFTRDDAELLVPRELPQRSSFSVPQFSVASTAFPRFAPVLVWQFYVLHQR
jgi:hypothetical protein